MVPLGFHEEASLHEAPREGCTLCQWEQKVCQAPPDAVDYKSNTTQFLTMLHPQDAPEPSLADIQGLLVDS